MIYFYIGIVFGLALSIADILIEKNKTKLTPFWLFFFGLFAWPLVIAVFFRVYVFKIDS